MKVSDGLGVRAGDRFENQELRELELVSERNWVAQTSPDGIASKTLSVALDRNALVRRFTVQVGARRADATTLANAGQVRLQTESGGVKIVVVDFGMLRTVSGVGVIGGAGGGITVCSLRAFKGAEFDTQDLWWTDCESVDIDSLAVRTAEQNTFEVRTERVRLRLKTGASLPQIAARVWLQFPDLPADLELRVGGGPPAWTSRGAVQPSSGGWDADSRQLVDLTTALAALSGDPTAQGGEPLELVLSSRVPGILELAPHTPLTEVSTLARLAVAGEERTVLDFASEGVEEIVLALPAWVHEVEELRLTATASPGAERILPPVGPPVATVGGGSTAGAELLLDSAHAAAARIDPASPLAELTAIRLPLAAGEDGAEARVSIYDGDDGGPRTAVAGATSEPVLLEPAAGGAAEDPWATFPFPTPIAAARSGSRWAVVAVTRGSVRWTLGRFDEAALAVPLRRGPITGPWHALPPALADAERTGARIRIAGRAAKEEPVAPYRVEVVGLVPGRALDLAPGPKGTAVTWTPAASGDGRPRLAPRTQDGEKRITLRLTSRVVGRVTLEKIDLVATRQP